MKIYEKEINFNEIEGELKKFEKPVKYEGKNYPYNSLDHRLFEILIYLIFEEEIKAGVYDGKYDRAHLMQAIGERGRDVLLTHKENYYGVIQCKNHKERLDKGKIAREIIKFVLYYIKDRNLISDINRFTYYLIAPSGFSESGLELLIKFNQIIINEENLRNWTEKLIRKYNSIRDLNYDAIQNEFIDILKNLKVEYKTAPDIDIKLNAYQNVISQIFNIQKVIDEEYFKKIINDSLEPIDITPRPDDEKIPILEILIKNFTIKYYAEGYQSSLNHIIYQLLEMINRYKPGYLERFAPNNSMAHEKIISYHFSNKYGKNLFPQIFQKKIRNGEIIYENVPSRDIFTHAGDLAYAVYELVNKDKIKENILIDDVRKEYNHIIQGKHEFFREGYRANTFEIILSMLEKSGIIKTTGPYTGSDCIEKYEIRSFRRLQKFIEKFSLENLLKTL